MPKNILGKWSVALAAANILLSAVSLVTVGWGDREPGTALQLIGGVSGILAIAAFTTGIIAIMWRKERAIIVYLGMVLIVLVLLLGEFLFPH